MPLAHFHCYRSNDIIETFIPGSNSYFDFNRLIKFQKDSDFYDEYNLNENGVRKLNSYLINDSLFLS